MAGTLHLCEGSLTGREAVKWRLGVFSYLAWTREFLNRDCLFETRDGVFGHTLSESVERFSLLTRACK